MQLILQNEMNMRTVMCANLNVDLAMYVIYRKGTHTMKRNNDNSFVWA